MASSANTTGITMVSAPSPRRQLAWQPLIGVAICTCVLHVAINAFTPYGFHRDELLYMAMGQHLRLWTMDFPPFIAIVSRIVRAIIGDSLTGIRLVPALAGGTLVLVSGAIASELGGGRKAQLLSALAVALSPLFIRSADLLQPVVFDQLWWSLCLGILARLCAESESNDALAMTPSSWVALGVAFGIGLLTKFSILFLGMAFVIALTFSSRRRTWLSRWPWIAALIAIVIGSPSVAGQWRLGYPVLAQMDALQRTQLANVSSLTFVTEQLLWGPGVLLALVGLCYLLFAACTARYRLLGLTCAISWLLLWVLHGKSYYIGPIYPTLFAAGGVGVENWSRRARGSARIVTATWVVLTCAYALVTFPLLLPILSTQTTAQFAARLGITAATRSNHGVQLRLPQDYADLLGWPEQARAVAGVYVSLPIDQRRQTVIMAENYGEAGAVDFYGARLGLPPAISAAGSYWFFGAGDLPGETVIALGVSRADLERRCGSVTVAGRVQNEWAAPEDSDVPLFLCRKPRQTLQQLWPSLAGRN
jgi:Dolichyl-phosphate-mannose-protein mannosyltransferase